MKRLGIFVILAVGCLACADWEVAKTAENATDLVVVNAALNPDEKTVSVYVGRGESNFGNIKSAQNLAVANAEVYIIEAQKRQRLSFSEKSKLYEISVNQFPILAGKRYFLEIVVGQKKVTAHCQVPEKISEPTLEASQKGRFIHSSITWQASQKNQFFSLSGYSFYQSQGIPVTNFANWDFDPTDLVVSVEDKQTFTKTNEIRLNIERALPPFIDAVVEIEQYDDNAAKYLTSVRSSNDTPQSSVDFFDKFSSPAIRYSNVQNGVGIVVGYNRYVVKKAVSIVR